MKISSRSAVVACVVVAMVSSILGMALGAILATYQQQAHVIKARTRYIRTGGVWCDEVFEDTHLVGTRGHTTTRPVEMEVCDKADESTSKGGQ